MSDENRIINLNPSPGGDKNVPLNLQMTHEPGFVKMTFDPPIVRAKFKPHEARTLGIALLQHADQAEHAPPKIAS